ncbi:hypothetical protein SAMD00023353_6400220 [Rosellinia necatrix]|uniref:Uncharacterized protein n=1 Tax=Rosellinia necatrix TaxID=77044 RepID=A0A1S8AAJ1_ROSNE|nr:hypothetical protein SAMD00023353_6400220 [Rosellinia necatrix]
MAKLAFATAASLLLATVRAMPNAALQLQPRATDVSLEPWVTVNEEGKASTVTPVLTTISGTPTVLSGAPHDVTATVFTYTSYGKVITTTASTPPGPTATGGGSGSGSFALCNNLDGPFAPWCRPNGETPLYVGTTYYFTWDPDFFPASNSSDLSNPTNSSTSSNSTVSNVPTVQIVGNHINKTDGTVRLDSPAFMSQFTMARLGYVAIEITDQPLLYQGSQNISTVLVGVVNGTRKELPGPVVTIMRRPGPTSDSKGKLPQGAALYIALPTVFGFIGAIVLGTCLWNRHQRRIQLPSVMGRNYDVSKTGRSRFGLKKRNRAAKASERIQLMEREIAAEGGDVYRDLPDPADRPRRDSDALGSLASTPTDERQMQLGHSAAGDASRTPATGNTFRDELRRQDRERS